MAMIAFHRVAGERALKETRSIKVLEGASLPPDDYRFIEFYCDDPACDCRRVIFQIWRESTGNKIWATITYGWEPPEYYAKWSGFGQGPETDEMSGAMLEQISPQTELSGEILELFRRHLQTDPEYVDRLKRHYQETCPGRRVIDRKRNPSGKVKRAMRERRRRRS